MGALGAVVGCGVLLRSPFWRTLGWALSLLAILVKRKPAVLRRFSIGLKMLVIQGRAGKGLCFRGRCG